ncbi:MAG TPA: tRNA (adenosine(37)-N6)-dimethylallyltransferase MiaA [Xanthobacteraceae bacterium]|nr:tRNA (adenosine(37)-N6)-dimethylallyltransferase MiaA [Xanthobacteraceae bacterium]
MMALKNAVLIAGPTASGKSALALELAARMDGVVINADSMQVYGDLRIITARPSDEEIGRAPHRLYGHVDAAEIYSAGRWLREAEKEIEAVQAAGRTAIIIGGTGLYFSALLKGLSAVPEVSAEVRQQIRYLGDTKDNETLHAMLVARDPRTGAEVRVSDRQRILRALEVIEATGRGLAAWREVPGVPVLNSGTYQAIFLQTDREALGKRIDARFDKMLEEGALEEVKALKSRSLNPRMPAMKAHGVPWLMRYLDGEISLEEAAAQGKRDTRQYAKRQETWFRNQLSEFRWVKPESAADALKL